jgi:hypothetical protein
MRKRIAITIEDKTIDRISRHLSEARVQTRDTWALHRALELYLEIVEATGGRLLTVSDVKAAAKAVVENLPPGLRPVASEPTFYVVQ